MQQLVECVPNFSEGRDSNKIDLNVIKAAWETNLKVRPEKDWENLIGRAVTKED